jgi:bis(5'-nucleosyl)-tetraphosphatase (symmetrical)
VATFAIGDVQGCFHTLERLLSRLRFESGRDRLWLTGDLVNRGPRSLAVLRWARGFRGRLVAVLGNHDLHLLGRALGVRRKKRGDTLDEVLEAPDRDELVAWLRRRPLLHREDGHIVVHAGLQPAWTPAVAAEQARELEAVLQGPGAGELLGELSRRRLPRWGEHLSGRDRRAVALQTFALMRTCRSDGRLCHDYSGPPEGAPPGCVPWFDIPDRRSQDVTVVCGHWAALGYRRAPGLVALDSGCVWGGTLSAIRLEDDTLFQEPRAD